MIIFFFSLALAVALILAVGSFAIWMVDAIENLCFEIRRKFRARRELKTI